MTQFKWVLEIDEPTRELAHGTIQGLIQALVQAHDGSWVPHEDGGAIALSRATSSGCFRQRCQLQITGVDLTAELINDFDDQDDSYDGASHYYGVIVDGEAHDAEGRTLCTLRAWEAALAQPVGDDAREIDMLRKEAMSLALGAVEALRLDWRCIAVSLGVDGNHRLIVITKSYSLFECTPDKDEGLAGRMNSVLAAKYDGLARSAVERHIDEVSLGGILSLGITSFLTVSLDGSVGPVERMAAIATLPADCRLILG
jgi:hypothetical protein